MSVYMYVYLDTYVYVLYVDRSAGGRLGRSRAIEKVALVAFPAGALEYQCCPRHRGRKWKRHTV